MRMIREKYRRASAVFRWRVLLPVVCLCLLTAGVQAEVFRAPNPGPGSVTITGPWQFHTSDDMAWANPAYDDSHWEQIRGDDTWGAQTHPSHTGFAWYRKSIDITGADKSLAILIPPVDDVYELFWNGTKIGTYGKLPPGAWWWAFQHSAVYSLPVDALGNANGVLAIRVWKNPLASTDTSTAGGLNAAPVIGNHAVLAMQAMEPRYERQQKQLPGILMAGAIFVAGLIALLLYLRERTQWLYLWLAIYLLADGLTGFRRLDFITYGLHFVWEQLYIQFVNSFQDISLWLLLLTLFGLSREARWRRWTKILALLYLVSQAIDCGTFFPWENAGLGLQWVDAITTAIYSLTPFFIFLIVGFGLARKRQMTLWPIAIAAFLYGAYNITFNTSGQGRRFTHWTLNGHMAAWAIHIGGYAFTAPFLLDLLLFIVLLITVGRQQLGGAATAIGDRAGGEVGARGAARAGAGADACGPRVLDCQHLQAGFRGGRGLLPSYAAAGRQRADYGRRCERQGAEGGHDGLADRGHATHAGRLHAAAGGDSAGAEPTAYRTD